MTSETILKESCVETFAEAQYAENSGAQLLELCSLLNLGGLTPSISFTQKCLAHLKLPIKVMIRPKSGNFIYNAAEIALMQMQILQLKKIGISHFVLGALTLENKIDLAVLKKLSETAGEATLTFHKAFDCLEDWKEGIDQLLDFENITHILSSGGAETALEGKEILIKLMKYSGSRITIIPAGKITRLNIHRIHELLHATHYHGRKIV